MASAAADGVFKYIYEGCIAGCDTGIERRPYHRNCSCALHKSSKTTTTARYCSHHGLPKCKSVTFPIRKSWSEGCLALSAMAATAGSSAGSAQSSPSSSSPAFVAGGGRTSRRLSSFDEKDQEGGGVFFKV